MQELNALQQSLFVLSALKNSMEPTLRSFKRYLDDEELSFVLSNKMIIDICSFKDEWNRLNPVAKNDLDVRKTLAICSVATRRIKKWSGLTQVRNTMLAHGFRDERKNGTLVDITNVYFNDNVPNNYAEILLLCEMAVFCCAIAIKRHNEDISGLDINHKESVVSRGITTAQDFDIEIGRFKTHASLLDNDLNSLWLGHESLVDLYKRF